MSVPSTATVTTTKARWLPIVLATSAALVASGCTAPTTSPSLPAGSAAAPATTSAGTIAPPAGPRLSEFGATIADWDANHRKDSAAPAGTAYNPGVINYSGRAADQFVDVLTLDTGRVVKFTVQLPRRTPFAVAHAAAVGELPPDPKVVWQRTLGGCRQELFSSAALGPVLGTPSIGDPAGLVYVEFESGDPAASYTAWSDDDVTAATMGLGATGIGSYADPKDAPDC